MVGLVLITVWVITAIFNKKDIDNYISKDKDIDYSDNADKLALIQLHIIGALFAPILFVALRIKWK